VAVKLILRVFLGSHLTTVPWVSISSMYDADQTEMAAELILRVSLLCYKFGRQFSK